MSRARESRTLAVEVKNLTKIYDSKQVVAGISFNIAEGETFGILGPNGAGKTTTLEMLEALRNIDGGSAHINNIDVANQPRHVKSIIGVQTQSTAFHDKVTLVEHIEFFASIFKQSVDPLEILRTVHLEDQAKKYVEQLSGGQKQRFSIAIAFLHSPRVLFLDEPTTGLDPQARRNLWELIANLKEKNITIILTTHYMEEAEVLCDRIAIMDQGTIIATNTPSRLISSYAQRTGDKKANLEDVFIDLTGKALRD